MATALRLGLGVPRRPGPAGGPAGGLAPRGRARAAQAAALTPIPTDYDAAVASAQGALVKAVADGVRVMEVEIPVGGLRNVPGDVEGNVEHNLCMGLIREFAQAFADEGNAPDTHPRRVPKAMRGKAVVLFPDKTELKVAADGLVAGFRQGAVDFPPPFPGGAFEGGRCTYLRDPSVLTEVPQLAKAIFGGGASGTKAEDVIARRISDSDSCFIVAYPSVNISDLTASLVELVDAVEASSVPERAVITVNGELDKIRSGYYPAIWTKFEMDELRNRMSRVEGLCYLHNFKGSRPAALWRVYPEPWQLFRYNPDGSASRIWVGEHGAPMPSLQRCALELIPKHYFESV